MRYKIVSESHPHQLEQKVKTLLDEGWRPQGGLTCHDNRFYQALTHPHDKLTKSEHDEIADYATQLPEAELEKLSETVLKGLAAAAQRKRKKSSE